ncbi:Hypothetical protein NTJ_10631 [Nesidiocoris tenuis]|uniref:EF-hand domain-containing protein n=1 Tax=Nesidiocoris tenuis TaxID=355587 RepID=A0ABN7B2G5_9HEMI|nr:Hypothetical protein NTJ_10631 [Nesidiocoris tenuis]
MHQAILTGSGGSGDRRRSGASSESVEVLAGGERRVSRTSCSSGGDHSLSSQSQTHQQSPAATKKVLFTDPPATTVSNGTTAKHAPLIGQGLEHQSSQGEEDSPKTQKKAVSTWKMACGMTKDKTKDLLKRWRTLPDTEVERPPLQEIKSNTTQGDHGWSVHVWGVDSLEESDSSVPGVATWVKRCPSDDEPGDGEKDKSSLLTDTQKEKLSHFFAHVFDMDRDDIISLQDIEGFTERLKHYTEWSVNSGEYLILQQVQQGLVETFIYPLKPDQGSSSEGGESRVPKNLDRLFLSIEEWLNFWGGILESKKNFHEVPLWLQYFPKILFAAINKSGTGTVTKDELSAFYSSVLGYPSQKLNSLVNEAYDAMTASGDFKLTYDCYRLCFANFLFGRYPNGPGQYIFGSSQRKPPPMFPVDYSAMNTPPGDIEPYGMLLKSSRTSIIV